MTTEAPPVVVERSGAGPGRSPHGGPLLHRCRLVVAHLGVVAVALAQQPGRVVPDTKLDLAVDPLGFLGRALRLWEPQGFAGQVQNQAYGYLFPMGPFFVAGEAMGLPTWLVQRLWVALLACAALGGVVALAGRLRIGTPSTRLVAGIAYALAPRMVIELGAASIAVLPTALAPWIVVPLVDGARGGSVRRAAARSALVVLCVGGVNAAASAVALVPAALYLLTREPGTRWRMGAWWAGGVVAATAWWAGPLLLLGRYSPPFLDYIESAATTTATADLTTALRGTTHWVAHLATPSGPERPAGWSLVHDVAPAAATVVLAAAGLAALCRRGLPDRRWLVACAVTGAVGLSAAHVSTAGVLFGGVAAAPLRTALDGSLAPLRNVHKADLVLRLALVLGLADLLARVARLARRPRTRAPARGVAVAMLVALAASSAPVWVGGLYPPTGFRDVPGYWREAADRLAAAPPGRALLLPASSFGDYVWGSPRDEPLQPLARSDWTVRDAVPLTPPGHIRMLDAIGERVARGAGGPGLTRALARAGITHLVVRHDLDPATGVVRPLLVHRALADSPGVARVATLGPPVHDGAGLPGLVLDAGTETPVPAVEIHTVAGAAPRAWTAPLASAVRVGGGPDALPALEDRGWISDRAVLFDEGAGAPGPGPRVISDAPVRRERAFGRVEDARSGALSATTPTVLDAAVPDYPSPDPARAVGVVRTEGATATASASAADADSIGGVDATATPYAAVDGDPATAWRPAATLEPEAAWWRLDLPNATAADAVTVTLGAAPGASVSDAPRTLTVVTDTALARVRLAPTTTPQRLPLPPGATRTLTLRVDQAPGTTRGDRLALAEVALPGTPTPGRTVVTPDPAGPVAAWAFDVAGPERTGCVRAPDSDPRCAAPLARPPEEPVLDRTFSVAPGSPPVRYVVGVRAVARPGPALDDLLSRAARGPDVPEVVASSTAVPDPRAGGSAAVDGDPGTAWVSAADDPDPRLVVRWDRPRVVDRVEVAGASDRAADPRAVSVSTGTRERVAAISPSGVAPFAPLFTDRLTVRFPLRDPLSSFDPARRTLEPLGVGVRELTVPGTVPSVAPGTTPVVLPCGQGPPVLVDGLRTETSVTTTVEALREGRPLPAVPCATAVADRPGLVLAPGAHRIQVLPTAALRPAAADLVDPTSDLAVAPGTASEHRRTPVATPRWDSEHRGVALGQRAVPTLLVVAENTNPGWVATADRVPLPTVTVDGWQQGWVVPPGPPTTLALTFTPGTPYRVLLVTGGLLAVGVVASALVPPRSRRSPASRERPRPTGRTWPGPVAGVALVAALAFAAGPVAVVTVGAVVVLPAPPLPARTRSRPPPAPAPWWGARDTLAAVAASGTVLAAGLALGLGPDGAGVRQVLAGVAVALPVGALLRGASRRHERRRALAAGSAGAP